MVERTRRRFWVELALAALTAAVFIATLVSREWIEELFGVEPDAGSGALEWGIVAALGAATLLFGSLARAEWKRRPAVT